jgi:hypothetical protein
MVNSFDSALADISGREQLMSMTGSGRTEVQSGEPVGEGAEDASPPMRDRSCARECAGPAAYRPEALAPLEEAGPRSFSRRVAMFFRQLQLGALAEWTLPQSHTEKPGGLDLANLEARSPAKG